MDQEKIQAFRDKQAELADVKKQDSQHQEVVGSLNNLLMATMVSKDPKMVEVAQNLGELLKKIGDASKSFGDSSLHLLPIANKELANSIVQLADKVDKHSPIELAPYFQQLTDNLAKVANTKPIVNVPKQSVTVDTKPLIDAVNEIKKSIDANKIDIPQVDFNEVVTGLKDVQKSIGSLRFPVPNYVLPFKDANGAATQALLNSDGSVAANAKLPSTLRNNQQTVTTSAVALPSGTLTQGVVLTSLSSNTDNIYIGGSGVTSSTGIEVQPGGSISAAVNNTNVIYVICAASPTGTPVISWLGS